mmetsp:Transcript_20527/g.55180  ORF Transcript_20527/g.55180 Transcript_20527/m.55180 type:complete len:209 (-) Transcript_20527:108-734(-)
MRALELGVRTLPLLEPKPVGVRARRDALELHHQVALLPLRLLRCQLELLTAAAKLRRARLDLSRPPRRRHVIHPIEQPTAQRAACAPHLVDRHPTSGTLVDARSHHLPNGRLEQLDVEGALWPRHREDDERAAARRRPVCHPLEPILRRRVENRRPACVRHTHVPPLWNDARRHLLLRVGQQRQHVRRSVEQQRAIILADDCRQLLRR